MLENTSLPTPINISTALDTPIQPGASSKGDDVPITQAETQQPPTSTLSITGKKRFLPPRKIGPLAEALGSTSELNDKSNNPIVTGEDFITIQEDDIQNYELMQDFDVSEEDWKPNDELPVSSFEIFDEDLESGLRSKAQEEEVSIVTYEKRHRKFELSEKKLKNREREKLAYERYQQQLAVEKLRNMEMNRLIPVAALRNNESSSTIDANGLEIMHKKLLREAEDTLKRYDELGLGGKKKKPELTTSSGSTTENEAKYIEEVTPKKPRKRSTTSSEDAVIGISSPTAVDVGNSNLESPSKKPKLKITLKEIKKLSKPIEDTNDAKLKFPRGTVGSTTVSFANTNTTNNENLPKLTTFILPNTAMPTGYRKSSRSALAFGVKVPSVVTQRSNFELLDELIRGLEGSISANLPPISQPSTEELPTGKHS